MFDLTTKLFDFFGWQTEMLTVNDLINNIIGLFLGVGIMVAVINAFCKIFRGTGVL